MLHEILKRIGIEYPAARTQSYADHPLANFIRGEASAKLRAVVAQHSMRLSVKGSAGSGNFAAVPWLGIFDDLVTDSATRGYYVVYLFSDTGRLFLSLNQGTTAVRQEFNRNARIILKDRATLMRTRLPEYWEALPNKDIELGVGQLPGDYEVGHVIGREYHVNSLPGENVLRADLQSALAAYETLIFRGGAEPSFETSSHDEVQALLNGPMSLIEMRRYRMHQRIERNPKAAQMAKFVHGTICQGCGFDFSERYGELGEGYIEAHHIRPLATLEEGIAIELNIERDFAVLCSNCHRMMHRRDGPKDLAALRALIKSE
jgi:5-methylcytosine-specific restriction protein A